jgi:hypothetical protein
MKEPIIHSLFPTPVAYPNDGQRYEWNEQNQTWDLINNI